MEVARNSEEDLGWYEDILDRGRSSASMLPEELLLRWFSCDLAFEAEERRYWTAGRKGLGASVFRGENMGHWSGELLLGSQEH